MMAELERNLKPFKDANQKVTNERERLNSRIDRGKVEQETLTASLSMVDQDIQSKCQHLSMLKQRIQQLETQIHRFEQDNHLVIGNYKKMKAL